MKRIANNVSLQTILYTIGGLQRIKVIDYKNSYEKQTGGEHKVIFDGLFKDKNYDTFNYWHERASVHGLIPDGDKLVIEICTAEENY